MGTSSKALKYTFLPCMCCVPNSDHVMFSKEFAFRLFINYAYMDTLKHVNMMKFEKKKHFSGVPSHGLKWENSTYKLKMSIRIGHVLYIFKTKTADKRNWKSTICIFPLRITLPQLIPQTLNLYTLLIIFIL